FVIYYSVTPRRQRTRLCPYTTLFRSGCQQYAVVTQLSCQTFLRAVQARRHGSVAAKRSRVMPLSEQRLLEFIRNKLEPATHVGEDRKSTRLNSSHVKISYAVFCLKKK